MASHCPCPLDGDQALISAHPLFHHSLLLGVLFTLCLAFCYLKCVATCSFQGLFQEPVLMSVAEGDSSRWQGTKHSTGAIPTAKLANFGGGLIFFLAFDCLLNVSLHA